MAERRKLSAALRDLENTVARLKRLDQQNQRRFRAGPGRPKDTGLSAKQFYLLTEGLFLHLFQSYETFIEECFILQMLDRLDRNVKSRRKKKSYVQPRDFSHARSILKGGSRFIDWNSPDNVIERSELFFVDGGVIKIAMTTNRELLLEMKRIRDRIAHGSPEADRHFRNVVRRRYLTVPTEMPSPGEFLQSTVRNQSGTYFLSFYFTEIARIANIVAR